MLIRLTARWRDRSKRFARLRLFLYVRVPRLPGVAVAFLFYITVCVPVISWSRGSGTVVSDCAVAACEVVPLRGWSAMYASAL